MKKCTLYISVILLSIVIHSCDAKKSVQASEDLLVDVQIDEELLLLTDTIILDTTLLESEPEIFMTYRRTYCFGMCPVFKSTIFSDGRVSYSGINFVDNIGEYQSQMSNDHLLSLMSKVHQVNYLELDTIYDNEYITDLPSVITSVNLDGESNHIMDRYQSPKELRNLYAEIDDIFATLEWKPASETE